MHQQCGKCGSQTKPKPGDAEPRREGEKNQWEEGLFKLWLIRNAGREGGCRVVVSLHWFCEWTGIPAGPLSVQCVDTANLSLLCYLLSLQVVTASGAALLSLHYGSDQGEIRLCHRPGRHIHGCVCPAAWWSRESPETAVPGPPELQRRSHWGDPQSPGRGNVIG